MRRLCIYILFLLLPSGLSAQEQPSCIPVRNLSQDSLAFRAGERLEFVMHYKWGAINSDIGTAYVQLDSMKMNGGPAYRCHVYGKTSRFYDLFFKVREDFYSWFSADGLEPIRFSRNTMEGKYVARNTYIYMWNAAEPYIDAEVYSSHSGQKHLELPLNRCTYDLPALFFMARNMDMSAVEPGVKYPMTFAIDDDIYNVYFILYGPETITVKGLGSINVIKFGARLIAGGVFSGDEDMTIYISDDENRLPVYFEAPILVGVASGRMVKCSGLKYPFSSRVEKSSK